MLSYRYFRMLRIKDWLFSFLPLMAAWCYLSIIFHQIGFSVAALRVLFLFLISTTGFAALGYAINEYFDKHTDQLAGKTNRLASLTPRHTVFLFFCTGTLAGLPWLGLPLDRFTLVLLTLEVVLFLSYAMPPLRLKNLWYISGWVDTAYAYGLPWIICMHTFGLFQPSIESNQAALWLGAVWLIVGYRNILHHQYIDRSFDERVGILTMPRKLGQRRTRRVFYGLLVLEVMLFVLLCGELGQIIGPFFYLMAASYIAYTAFHVLHARAISVGNQQWIFHFSLNPFYQIYMPLICLLFLSYRDIRWSAVLLGHMAVLVPWYVYEYYFIRVRHIARWMMLWAWRITSYAVNYLIYYLFLLIFGVDLKKEQLSALDYLRKRCGHWYK